MRDVLALHLKMQRRAHLEMWIVVGSIMALTIFFTASVGIHWYVQELDDTLHSSPTTAQHFLPQPKKKKHPKRLMLYQQPPGEETQRQQFEREHPTVRDQESIYQYLKRQRMPLPNAPSDLPYDILDCPATPPDSYPATWNAVQEVLRHWNPDTVEIPSDYIHQSLCVLDWRNPNHATRIDTYRRAEVPFVLVNHPEVANVAYRWQQPGYLERLVGRSTLQRNEYGHHTNHLMYWRPPRRRGGSDGPKPPVQDVELNISDWMNKADAIELLDSRQQSHADHWYLRLNAALPDHNTYLYDELPFFQPSEASTMFMVDSFQQRGINCRLGMKGSIAEAHYDPTRNWLVLLQGRRRYILAHPRECPHLELYPFQHPSGRHSSVNWSSVVGRDDNDDNTTTTTNNDKQQQQQPMWNRPFAQLRVTEVVLQAGDALYLPTSWFHFIVSLNKNYQCNARSGATYENAMYMERCGFPMTN